MSKALTTLALALAVALLGVAWAAPEETAVLSPDIVPQVRAEVWTPAAPADPLPRAWQVTRKAVPVQHMFRTSPSL